MTGGSYRDDQIFTDRITVDSVHRLLQLEGIAWEICGSLSGTAEDCRPLGCHTVLIGKNIFADVSRNILSSVSRCPKGLTSGSRIPRGPQDDDNMVHRNANISSLTSHKSWIFRTRFFVQYYYSPVYRYFIYIKRITEQIIYCVLIGCWMDLRPNTV